MRNVFLVLVAIALAGCEGVMQPPTTAQHLESAVTNINRDGTDQLSEELPSTTMTAMAEGEDTLVVSIGNVPTGNVEYDPAAVRKLFRPEICAYQGAKYFLENGGKIRLEVTSNFGKKWRSVGIVNC